MDLLIPSLSIRLQVRSTSKSKHGGSRRAVGQAYQQAFGIDPEAEPWDDPAARRKVRWVGLVLLAFGTGVIVLGLRIWLSR